MVEDWPVRRSQGVAAGRSAGSAFGGLAYVVATSDDKSLGLEGQADRCFRKIERVLGDLGTDKRYILSAQILFADLSDKDVFEGAWLKWVGLDPRHWPQRSCIGAILSAGTLIEITVTAANPTPN